MLHNTYRKIDWTQPKMKILAEFGKITIDGKEYWDVILLGEQAMPRGSGARAKYRTNHIIGEEEAEILLKGLPELIIIGTGFDGVAKLTAGARQKILKSGAKLIEKKTPEAIEEFLRAKTKKKAALIHSTC